MMKTFRIKAQVIIDLELSVKEAIDCLISFLATLLVEVLVRIVLEDTTLIKQLLPLFR